jgi:hypothetical protein
MAKRLFEGAGRSVKPSGAEPAHGGVQRAAKNTTAGKRRPPMNATDRGPSGPGGAQSPARKAR